MADKKISELTQLTSANAITDVFPIVDSSLDQTDKITAAKLPMSASATARSYPYTIDFQSGSKQIRNLTTIDTSSGYQNNSNLTSIYIGSHVTAIGTMSFNGCTGLSSIVIPNSVTSIAGYALQGCTSLTSITISSSVTLIDSSLFEGCSSLTSITIPNSVTSIGFSAFDGCTSLTSITIPDSVTSIGSYAFQSCSNLTTISSLATDAPTLGNQSVFLNVAATKITVPVGAIVSYQTAGNGTTYGGLIIEEA